MKTKRVISILVIILNLVGIVCLIYFAIPYFTHDVTVANPDAMLPFEAWDRAGIILTIGLIPLVIANAMSYYFIKMKSKSVRVLSFIPSIVCLLIVISYFIGCFR